MALLADLANGENRARADTHPAAEPELGEIQPGDDQVLGERTSLQVEAAGSLEGLDVRQAEDAHLTMAGPGVRVALDAVILP